MRHLTKQRRVMLGFLVLTGGSWLFDTFVLGGEAPEAAMADQAAGDLTEGAKAAGPAARPEEESVALRAAVAGRLSSMAARLEPGAVGDAFAMPAAWRPVPKVQPVEERPAAAAAPAGLPPPPVVTARMSNFGVRVDDGNGDARLVKIGEKIGPWMLVGVDKTGVRFKHESGVEVPIK